VYFRSQNVHGMIKGTAIFFS